VTSLSSRQRKYLRGLAHSFEPIVHVGKGGITEALLAQIDRALDIHELIKVRFVEGKEQKASLVAAIVERTGAAEAGRVGHVAILYRGQPDPEKRRIELPD
jgi:RNA-binding protein